MRRRLNRPGPDRPPYAAWLLILMTAAALTGCEQLGRLFSGDRRPAPPTDTRRAAADIARHILAAYLEQGAAGKQFEFSPPQAYRDYDVEDTRLRFNAQPASATELTLTFTLTRLNALRARTGKSQRHRAVFYRTGAAWRLEQITEVGTQG